MMSNVPPEKPLREYVYFIRCGDKGPIKIGKAVDLKKRLSGLQVGNPHRLVLLMAVEIEPGEAGARELEAMLHEQLRPYCVRGEWFRSKAALIAAKTVASYVEKEKLANVIRPHQTVTRTCY